MGRNPAEVAVARIRTLVSTQQAKGQSDGELLRAYALENDQAAFGVLVKRHGPLVFGVCKRVLHHEQDSQDSFQAVFIVLAKKAASLRKHHSLAGWLHQVGHRVALAARRAAIRRRRHESEAKIMEPANPAWQAAWREVQALLDEEIQRLPQKYREPFVLCCLENLSCAQAALRLGVKEGTVWSRLAEARKRLQARLTLRGVALSTVLGAFAIAPGQAAANLPVGLAAMTVSVASASGKCTLSKGLVSKQVAALVRGVTTGGLVANAKVGVMLTLMVSALAGVAGMYVSQDTPSAAQVNTTLSKGLVELPALHVDQLPAGALARAGTLAFRHGSAVNQVVFSPDGRALASVAQDGTMRVWDAVTGEERRHFQNGSAGFWSVAYSPDGKFLASGEGNNAVRIWEVATGNELGHFQGESLLPSKNDEPVVSAVAFSPAGRIVATLSLSEMAIRLRDVIAGKELRQLKGNGIGFIRALAFSPDGKTLASGERGCLLRIWDVASGKEIRRFSQDIKEGNGLGGTELSSVTSVVFSPDGTKVVTSTGYEDATVHIYDLAKGTLLRKIDLPGKYSTDIALSPDGRMLATATYLSKRWSTIILWDLATGKELRRTPGLLAGLFSLAFSPNSKVLASGGLGSRVQLWDVATCAELRPARGHQGRVEAVAISPKGNLLASVSGYDDIVRLWDAVTGNSLGQLTGHEGGVRSLAFSADGRTLATGGNDETIRLWDLAQRREFRQWRAEGEVGYVHFSPDGNSLASQDWPPGAGPGVCVRLWDLKTGKQSLRLPFQSSFFGNAAISPDGLVMAAPVQNGEQSRDYTIFVWDLPTGRERWRLAGHTADVWAVALSADGRFLASKSLDNTIRLWELISGKEVWRAEEHRGPKGNPCLALSPNMRILASGGDDNTVHIWDLAEGKQLPALGGHQGPVRALVFSSDGRRLVSGSEDSTLLVWNASAWELTRRRARFELDRDWQALANTDAPMAYQAMLDLAAMQNEAVSFLHEHMRPASPVDPEVIAQMLVELDSKDFRIREAASNELKNLDEVAEPAMRAFLTRKPSPEAHARISQILDALQKQSPVPDTLRIVRAIGVLEQIAKPEARRLLEELAKGATGARSTREAKASMERLARQNIVSP
jgi:RNA polymerase sigma factor (sigma-70 family)